MDALAQHAARRPDAPAVVDGDRTFTWRAYHEARNRLARGLRRLGLDAGDHVVVHAANSAEYLLAGAAARAIGAVPVAMNHRLTADEAAHVLDDSDATLVFVGEEFLDAAERLRPRAPRVRHWIALGAHARPWMRALTDVAAAGSAVMTPSEARLLLLLLLLL